MSESMSCWICATIESALDDMAVLLLHNRWVVLPIIAQSRRSFNANRFICRFRMRLHGFWSHSNDFEPWALIGRSLVERAAARYCLAASPRAAASIGMAPHLRGHPADLVSGQVL